MLTRRTFTSLSLAALLTVSCGNLYPFTVLKQAAPNPLAGQKKLGIAPISLDQLTVDGGDPATYRPGGTHHDFTKRFSAAYEKELGDLLTQSKIEPVVGAPSPAAPLWIRPRLLFIEAGMTLGAIYNEASEAKMEVDIIRPDGTVLDTISMKHATRNERDNIQAGEGLKKDGEDLAAQTVMYIYTRVNPN